MLVVVQAFFKVLFYLKIFPDYGFLVKMIRKSIWDIGGFLAFFSMWILFFTIQYKVLGAEFDLTEYSHLNRFVQLALVSFRNALGDIQIAAYSKYTDPKLHGDRHLAYVMVVLIWVYWFANIGLMLIILMNFLIAVISESYTTVSEGKVKFQYKDKAEMNLECQQLLSLISPQKDLKCVSFTTDKSLWTEAVDPNADIKNSIKAFLDEQRAAILTELRQVSAETRSSFNQLRRSLGGGPVAFGGGALEEGDEA